MKKFRLQRCHKDMEALRCGIRKARQGTRGGLDGQYKRYTHLCKFYLSCYLSLLTEAIPTLDWPVLDNSRVISHRDLQPSSS